jgi:hypothetical protein
MKKFFKNVHEKVRQSWQNLMNSPKKKMSEGAQELTKTRTVAHKDQWRHDHGHSSDKKKHHH